MFFAGTPDFAAIALRTLYEAGFAIPLVLTQPDRPAGRGMQLRASAVKQYALTQGLPMIQPVSLRLDGKYPDAAQAAQQTLQATVYDVMVVAAYGLILPRWTLQLPRHGCLNIHASLLPRWRGAAPIQRAIEARDLETGVTIMQMDEGLDTGAMLLKEAVPIAASDTAGDLQHRLQTAGAQLIVETLHALEKGTLKARRQPDEGVCYAAKISKEEAVLDFSKSAEEVVAKIHAFNPAPGAYAWLHQVPIKFWRAQLALDVLANVNAVPGQVLTASVEQGIVIACGQRAVRITELQKPGGKALNASAFLAGFALEGSCFNSAAPLDC